MYFVAFPYYFTTTQQQSKLRTPPHTALFSFSQQLEVLLSIGFLFLLQFRKQFQYVHQIASFLPYNNFNIIDHMSASLPRIKTINQLSANLPIQGLQKLKFRKIALEPTQNGQERKKSVKILKTERLKSLERYSTVQEQKEYKNEKIHLNLIERKLLNGTYDQKKETGNELNTLKQKRDHIKVETILKQREIQRVRILLEDMRKQIDEFNSKKGLHDIKLKEIKEKHQLQIQKTEAARQTKGVFQNMVKIRHEINMVLCKRTNDLKQQLGYINSALTLVDTELRQATQKCAIQETKLEQLTQVTMIQRNQRNVQIGKHQDKISKRKQVEVLQAEKSKQYIALLDQVERESQMNDFKAIYKKILANLFISRYCKKSVMDLTEKYQPYERSYGLVSSYKSFGSQNPKNLVTRYMQQEPQRVKNMKIISEKEKYLNALQTKNQALKKRELQLYAQAMQFSQNLEKITTQNQHQSQIFNLKESANELQQKMVRVKTTTLKMLKDLNQKGDRRLSNGYQPALNNLIMVYTIILQLIKE